MSTFNYLMLSLSLVFFLLWRTEVKAHRSLQDKVVSMTEQMSAASDAGAQLRGAIVMLLQELADEGVLKARRILDSFDGTIAIEDLPLKDTSR